MDRNERVDRNVEHTSPGRYVFINVDVSTRSHNTRPWWKHSNSREQNNRARDAFRALKTVSLRRYTNAQFMNVEERVGGDLVIGPILNLCSGARIRLHARDRQVIPHEHIHYGLL